MVYLTINRQMQIDVINFNILDTCIFVNCNKFNLHVKKLWLP